MKRITFIRLSVILIILSLLFITVPVSPAYADGTISISTSTGKIGDSVTIHCSFPSSASERFVNIYFSSSNLSIGPTSLITAAPSYKYVGGGDIPTSSDPNSGNVTVTFTVPSVLNSGTVTQNVTTGTYYILVTYIASGIELGIQAKAAFTVTAPALDPLSPVSGPPGTDVLITGTNFPAGAAITVKLDGTAITIVSGATVLSTGAIATHITIPAGTLIGAHTISVTAGGYTASKAFNVTAPAAIGAPNPASGPPGTHVALSGTNFPPSTVIVFMFDTTPLTPTGSSQTGADGSFASIITIPASATAGDHTITVTVGSTVKTATFTVTGGSTTPPPTATLNALIPDSGPPGTSVAISGANFAASSTIIVTFDTTTVTLSGSAQTGADGSFSGVIVIPTNATAGAHTITVTVGANSATTTFTVTQAEPTTPPPSSNLPLDVELGGDYVGASISIASSGFIPNASVTVAIDGQNITQRNATESGLFFTSLKLPNLTHGEHAITATDGTNTATATFNIESEAPDTPQPLSPAMGEAIPAPASFDWADVTDNSTPITYNLQIATSDTFDANSIVLNVTGITESKYTLTEDEQLRLSSEIVYYWREQAVDAASNASPWTGAGEFTMVKPFEFIGWPLYLTIGLGGLVLFLLGLWVGRRTAFYY